MKNSPENVLKILSKSILSIKEKNIDLIHGTTWKFSNKLTHEIIGCCAIGSYILDKNLDRSFGAAASSLKISIEDLMNIVAGFDGRLCPPNQWTKIGKELVKKFKPKYYDKDRRV